MDILKQIAAKVASFAPALGAALVPVTGGASLPIGVALTAIIKAFGLAEDAKPEAILQALTTDPETKVKLVQAENAYLIEIRKIEREEYDLTLKDIQGARNMRVDHEKLTGKGDMNLYILAWVVVGGFFGLIGCLLIVALPPDQTGVVFMLFGALSTGFGQVLQFFFGSSKSSQQKTDIIAKSDAVK